jgi:anaerobic sulfite reductase subunit C
MAVDHHIEDTGDRVNVDIDVEGRTGEVDFGTLKTGGIIKQRQKDQFTVRLMCPGGRLPVERLARVAEVARRYGGDYVHLSVRQSVEIPYVDARDLGKVRDALAEVGQKIASCGARVRVPVACSGCEYNPNGLTATQEMARRVTDRFFGTVQLPHKFKMSFSGCPINCIRTHETDLGFQGAVEPQWDADKCTSCGICIQACKEGAIVEDDAAEGRPRFVAEKCLHCGDCIRSCPVDAWTARRTGWVVRCGGKHGRHPITGQVIARFLPDERVPEVIEAVLGWYETKGEGKGRVRLGQLLLDPRVWKRFLSDIASALGGWVVTSSPPPQPNEIHFGNSAVGK